MIKWKHHPLHKGLALLLAVVLACGLLTALTPSAAASETSGSCGENLTWVFDETTGTLTISGEGEMDDYSKPWYDYRSDIREVRVNSGVTSIGKHAFDFDFTNLSKISLPDTLNTIGEYAFSHCTALTSVDIPESVKRIENNAFSHCTALTSIVIPESVESTGYYAFRGCTALTSVVILESVKRIDAGSFSECTALTSVVIPDSVESIGWGAFEDCTALSSVVIPDTVSHIGGYAFSGTPWLKKQTGFVIVGDGILLDYHGTDTDLVIPSGVKYIAGDFWSIDPIFSLGGPNGTPLNSVTFPEGLLEIGEEAFSGFAGTEVYFPSTLRSIGTAAFCNALNLTSAYFYGDAPIVGRHIFKTSTKYTKESVVFHYIDGKSGWTSPTWEGASDELCPENPPDEYPTEIWDGRIPYAVEGGNIYFNAETGAIVDADETITAANIPEKIKGWDVRQIFWDAFEGCDSLVNVTIPSSVTSMESETFHKCSSLTGIWVDEQNEFYSSDDLGVLFDKNQTMLMCAPRNIQGSYTIPDGVTFIDAYAFQGCSGLTSISIPGSITDFGKNVFENCKRLENIKIADGATRIGSYAFCGCESLTSVVIPESVEEIYIGAFKDCKKLESIKILNPRCAVYCVSVSGLINSTLGTPGFTTVYSYEGATGCVKDMDGTGAVAYYPQSYAETFGYDFKLIAPDEPNPPQPVENPFTDVTKSCYFYEPVLWSVEHDITKGITETTFGPERSCTRAQAVTFLWRACGCPEPKGGANPFTDVKESEYYYKAVLWAVENGVTLGVDKTRFAPDSTVTRGQFVTFLWRVEGKPEAADATHSFTDLKSNQYYYDAVLWAVENGVTLGVDKTHFAPEHTCVRGQVVTFLYRNFAQ